MKLEILFSIFINNLMFIHSSIRILPNNSIRNWRCPGEECNNSNVCLGSSCKCNYYKNCYCKIIENKHLSSKSWDEITNVCTGYLNVNEECQHSKFCFTRDCKSINGKKICIEDKRDMERNDGAQSTLNDSNLSTKLPRPNTSLNKDNAIKCKISMDCKRTQACYEGICVNWGSQCIGQKECENGCCEGGYCQTDDSVCNKYFSTLTLMIITWLLFGFGFLNCFFWIIWYCVGRQKITSLTSVGGGQIVANKGIVQGMPITTNNIIQTNNLGNNMPLNNNVVLVKNDKDKISNNYQNIHNMNVHFE